MNELELNKLFEKRVFAYYIDLVIYLVLFTQVVEYMPYSIYSTLYIPLVYFIYFDTITIITKGQTIGLFLMKIKIVHLTKRNFIEKIFYSSLRHIYSTLAFYAFRIFLFPKMNNIGQLKFDERFNMTIVPNDKNIDVEKSKTYFNVHAHPLKIIKLFFLLLLVFIIVVNLPWILLSLFSILLNLFN